MTITTQEKIVREVARLRMEQSDGDPDQLENRTALAHGRINALLDQLDAEKTVKVIKQVRRKRVTNNSQQ